MRNPGDTFETVVGRRLAGWSRDSRLGRRLATALVGAAAGLGIVTSLLLNPGTALTRDPDVIRIVLLADLVMVLLLLAVVARRLVRLWVERRRGSAGSRLHTRLVGLFSAVAVAPAIVMAIFSALFLNIGLQTWFGERVKTAVTESVAVAEAYIGEHRKVIQADVLAMAADLNRDAPRLARNPPLLQQVVTTQARLRDLSEAIVIDRAGQVIARSGLSLLMEFERVPPNAIEKAAAGEVVITTSEYEDRIRALVRLDAYVGAYLYVGRLVEPRVLDHLQRTREAAAQYTRLEAMRSDIEVTFAVLFILVSLLLLLAAIWFGLSIATRLVRPIGSMVAAAERVREGDLDVQVEEGAADDEMGTLGRAFNRMTTQLGAQRRELVEANRQLDERRRFTETVLAGVSAGVIGVGRDGRITLPNPSAVRLLDMPAERLVGRPFAEVVPEMAGLFAEATSRVEGQWQGQAELRRGGASRSLLVRVSRETTAGETVGYVVTFDDVTELVSAQRTAAWADVARRIAHEIKNPLTPIQLSAERLKRKYAREIASDPEVFAKCTDTIIRQVTDIGRMVDEFSSFARLPAPTFRAENLVELVRQAVFLQHVGHADIDYVTELPEAGVAVRCDGRQIAQVLTNVLKNAAEAIEGRGGDGAALPKGRIAIGIERAADGAVVVVVTDNGRGLPEGDRARLTEPYVTTRAKGTGLGLAIVRKIMEEHGGQLVLEDAPGGGARVRLVFPKGAALAPAAAEPLPAARAGD